MGWFIFAWVVSCLLAFYLGMKLEHALIVAALKQVIEDLEKSTEQSKPKHTEIKIVEEGDMLLAYRMDNKFCGKGRNKAELEYSLFEDHGISGYVTDLDSIKLLEKYDVSV